MPFPEARTRKVAGSRTEVQQGCGREHRSEVKSWRSGAGAVREIWTESTPSPGRFELDGVGGERAGPQHNCLVHSLASLWGGF